MVCDCRKLDHLHTCFMAAVLYGEAVLTNIEERPVLSRLRRVSRRIGGWMAARKRRRLRGSSNKASKKPSPKKQEAKAPASKTKDVKAKAKPTSKAPAAKPTAKAAASVKPVAKPTGKATAKPVKAGAKAEVKSTAAAKSAAVKSVPLKAVPEKAPAKVAKVAKKQPEPEPEADVVAELDSEFDTTDIVDSDLEGAVDLAAVEPLDEDPSAVRRAAMSLKGPVEAEKVAQRRRKRRTI